MTSTAAQVGRYDEALCYFERLQQNLLFLAMLADQQVGWLHALEAPNLRGISCMRLLRCCSDGFHGLRHVLHMCCVKVRETIVHLFVSAFLFLNVPYCSNNAHALGVCTARRSHGGVFGVAASGIFNQQRLLESRGAAAAPPRLKNSWTRCACTRNKAFMLLKGCSVHALLCSVWAYPLC